MRRILFLTLVWIGLATCAHAQWTFVDSLRLGGIPSAVSVTTDSSGHVLLYSSNPSGLLVYDTTTHTWSNRTLPVAGAAPVLAVMPSGRILAGFLNAVYYSDDDLGTWNVLGRGLTITKIAGFAWNDTTLLAIGSGASSGIMVLNRSDSNWQSVGSSLGMKTLGMSVRTSNGYFVVGSGRRLFRSRDGMTWDPNDTAIIDPKIAKTVVADNGNVLAVGQYSSSIFLSTDWGVTWTEPFRLAGLFGIHGVFALKQGVVATTTSDGFYASYDNGLTWRPVRSVFAQQASGMTLLKYPQLVVASAFGVYISRDSAATWKELDSGWTRYPATAVAAIGDTVFVSESSRGIYRSSMFPAHWIPTNDSLSSWVIGFSVAHGAVYGETSTHLVQWNGASWSALPNMFDDKQPITYAMSKSGRMFAATASQFFYLGQDTAWHTVLQLFPLLVRRTVADSTGRIYALVGTDSVFCSTDDGVNWALLSNLPSGMMTLAVAGDTLLVATTDPSTKGLYLTNDLGAHWTTMPYSLVSVTGLEAFHGRYFAYSSTSLLEREAHGANWTQTIDIPSTESIIGLSISPNGRAYLLTQRGLYSRVLPSGVNSVAPLATRSSILSVYPNPATSTATISGAESAELFDVHGRRIQSVSSGAIDCAQLAAGVYEVRSRDGRMARLVIVR